MIPLSKLKKMSDKYPQKAAIIEGNKVLTYNDLYTMTGNGVSNIVSKYNIQKLKRIVFISENRYEMLVLMSIFSTLKVTFLGLDFTGSIQKKIECIKSIDAEGIVYTKRYADEVKLINKGLNLLTICVDKEFTDLVRKPDETQQEFDASGISRPFESISFTSGTSGIPKVVYRDKSFDGRRFPYLIDRFGFTELDLFLVTVPFYHVSAMGWGRLFLNIGATIVLGDINNPVSMAADLVKYKITTTLIVPNILEKMTKAFEERVVEGSISLNFIIVGGKHFPADLKRRSINVFGSIVHEYYGSTETGVNVIAEPHDLIAIADSSGKEMDGSRVKILDDRNIPLPRGIKGHVAISSYQNMKGYLNAESNKVEIEDTDYIVTPDYGWMDDNGYLFLTSRSTPDINIYKLENEIVRINGIEDSYIFTGDDDRLYCVVTINHELNSNLTKVKNILESNGFNDFKIINTVIPYSMSGKVNLEKLKGMVIRVSNR
ncbi:class I adenylate-forming enzyme family protein [Ruminiclostridium papyrosolvens DSM 2782]|uniref:ANL family adenylate-forming protein n=2 Tax=Ruminiclostridium papyrosolvens TaxID=29362 RepID=UPI0023E3F2CD|nr:class I adenylate-forming enzyme family protein [Ruminiclostridium papyrosolvens]WES34516.1 class I adenylate-forming enzyme family protein [Ruminiclostridium papyrosolvens DSM 2782]